MILVRHAETDWTGARFCGSADLPLNAAGRRHADELAAQLAPTLPPGVRLVSSPLRRAVETATAIARAAGGIDVTVDERWREVDMGDVEGLTWDEAAARWPDLAATLASGPVDIGWPGGDAAGALTARVGAAWSDMSSNPRPAIVVSHGGPIRLALRLAGHGSVGEPPVVSPGGVIRVTLADPARTGA
ncbi:MAG TPA: histidine phosphatase family protein [Candidatus Limnocylindrales bacterium]|nr:histidine phosphatase family protein [Candidatus Limnocylindrales bacterium]